jgi:transcriptional regulator GlxA family with amidase domain
MTNREQSRVKAAAPALRVVVVVVPPVEELDLVGPFQVFSAANRLARKPMYNVEIATNGKDLTVEGKVACFRSLQKHFGPQRKLRPVLLVWRRHAQCARPHFSLAPEDSSEGAATGIGLRGRAAVCRGGPSQRTAGTSHWRFSEELARRYPR